MSIKKSSESRRKLLKSIAAGSGAIVAGKSLPENWSRPVVDSVMLPAHAQTSGPIYSVNNTRRQEDFPDTQPDFDYIRVCAVVSGDYADVTFQPIYDSGGSDAADVLRTGLLPIDGSGGSLNATPQGGCDNTSRQNVGARITAFDSSSLTLTVSRPNGNDIVRVVPVASSCVTFITSC